MKKLPCPQQNRLRIGVLWRYDGIRKESGAGKSVRHHSGKEGIILTRTRLCDRILPDYTRGEEIFNTASHIAGGLFGIAALVLSLRTAVLRRDVWEIVAAAVYGASMVLLYTASSVYHGLAAGMAKKVLQVIDHCTIYLLIAGTYTPILLCSIRPVSPAWAWVLFGVVWGCAVLGAVFTGIDLKKYAAFSMICYLGMGWCVVFAIKTLLESVPLQGVLWILAGGIAYSLGAVLYGLGSRHRYMHSIFHLFVVAGSVLQFIGILRYVF